MWADWLAIGLELAELEEGRIGFILVNLNEMPDRQTPAFWGHQEVLALLYFTPPRLDIGVEPSCPAVPRSAVK